jgi:hypothetical protein
VPEPGRRVRADLAAAAPGAQRVRVDAGSALTNAMGR